jgi:frataxin-like iron-binding protein CyaY
MGIDDAIKKLETSNQGLKTILENLDEQLSDIRLDPRFEGLIDDLENLFFAYLKTWIKTNTEIIDILEKEKK